jgi:hypothetical protein
MARKASPGDDGGVVNVTNAMVVVQQSVKKIVELKEQRKKVTAAINSERAQCKAAGVPAAALDLAIRIKEMDPEQRAAHDEGYLIARRAIGLPVQQDLFETINNDGKTPEIQRAQEQHVEQVKAMAEPKVEPEVAKSRGRKAKGATQPEPTPEEPAQAPEPEEKPNPFDDDDGELSPAGKSALDALRESRAHLGGQSPDATN